MTQLINITSEALQATIRRLLPSQAGFSEDLQATNLITPIIDLTPTAEGSQLPEYLQQAFSFNSQTAIAVSNNTFTYAQTGFHRLYGVMSAINASASPGITCRAFINTGLATKFIFGTGDQAAKDSTTLIDCIVFLDTAHSINITSNNVGAQFDGSIRQIADRYGNLINPAGFTFE